MGDIFEEVPPYAASEERSEEDEERNQVKRKNKTRTRTRIWSSSLRMKTLVTGK